MAGDAGQSAWNAVMQTWRRLLVASRGRRGLPLAFLLLTLCLFAPQAVLPARVADWFIVVDITQSMNVRDYSLGGKNISRLEFAKTAIRESLRDLPCGSRISLGLFTERDTLPVTRPLEVCSHYAALDQIVARMDWRMAWAADSFIAHGLYSAIEQSARLGAETRLMFITDGNQAPPADPRYMPVFSGKPGAVRGAILGSGKPTLSAIPKLDAHDEIGGYWTQEEAQQYGNFGMAETLSVLAMEQGQHDRNAGHGPGNALLTSAHMSKLDETNLRRLSAVTGLSYARLDDFQSIKRAMLEPGMRTWRSTLTDLRPWLGAPALLFILLFFIPPAWQTRPAEILYFLNPKRRTA